MTASPWYRRLAASLLISLWNARGAVSYALRQRRQRTRIFRRMCSENGLAPAASSERALHRYSRQLERHEAELVIGSLLDDNTRLDRICRRFRVLGREVLEAERGKGAVLVSFHVGPFSLLGPLLTWMGFDLTVLVRGDELQAATGKTLAEVNRFLADRLGRHTEGAAQLVDSQAMLSLVQIKKALGRRGLVLVYPDTAKSSSVSWAPVPFFRQQLAGHVGLAKLLQMTRADVLYLFTSWDEDGGLTLEVQGPYSYAADAPPEVLLQAIYAPLEGLVARRAAQWTQVHSYDELKFDYPLPER